MRCLRKIDDNDDDDDDDNRLIFDVYLYFDFKLYAIATILLSPKAHTEEHSLALIFLLKKTALKGILRHQYLLFVDFGTFVLLFGDLDKDCKK